MMGCLFSDHFTDDDCAECNFYECEHNVNPENPEVLRLEPEDAILFMGGR